jgi:hypothetical protein
VYVPARPGQQCDEFRLTVRPGLSEDGFELATRRRDSDITHFGNGGQCLALGYTEGNLGLCRR